jgi:PLP dependent protein
MLSTPQISAADGRIAANLALLRERITAAAATAGRRVDQVTLLAVSKGHGAGAVRAAHALGLVDFGENYVAESLTKIRATADLPLRWHFIGRLQANKTRAVAEHFAWVHGIDRLRIAERLSEQRAASAPPLDVCVQVNVAGEATKGGVAPAELPELLAALRPLPRLRLRGLMCMLPYEADALAQRDGFAALRRLLEQANAEGAALDTLSMGMSADLEAAVLEGATILRIGTALFGERTAAAPAG